MASRGDSVNPTCGYTVFNCRRTRDGCSLLGRCFEGIDQGDPYNEETERPRGPQGNLTYLIKVGHGLLVCA